MYHLFLVTPEQVIFDGEVSSMIVPGKAGYFEVLTNHAPIISSLRRGKIVITDKENKKMEWIIPGGVVEVLENKASLLADSVDVLRP